MQKKVGWIVVKRRTPRNFDGTKTTFYGLQDLLPETLASLDLRMQRSIADIRAVWPSVIGEKMLPFTELCDMNGGVLFVKVKSSTLYSLLSQMEGPRLLKALQVKCPEIKKLKFRFG